MPCPVPPASVHKLQICCTWRTYFDMLFVFNFFFSISSLSGMQRRSLPKIVYKYIKFHTHRSRRNNTKHNYKRLQHFSFGQKTFFCELHNKNFTVINNERLAGSVQLCRHVPPRASGVKSNRHLLSKWTYCERNDIERNALSFSRARDANCRRTKSRNRLLRKIILCHRLARRYRDSDIVFRRGRAHSLW